MANRLLIAEDDRAVRESLVRALGLEGYDVVATPPPWTPKTGAPAVPDRVFTTE